MINSIYNDLDFFKCYKVKNIMGKGWPELGIIIKRSTLT